MELSSLILTLSYRILSNLIQYAIKDGSVKLSCEFDLETDTLLVLKWYKDADEFFRVSPQTSPQKLIFPVDGINIDVSLNLVD